MNKEKILSVNELVEGSIVRAKEIAERSFNKYNLMYPFIGFDEYFSISMNTLLKAAKKHREDGTFLRKAFYSRYGSALKHAFVAYDRQKRQHLFNAKPLHEATEEEMEISLVRYDDEPLEDVELRRQSEERLAQEVGGLMETLEERERRVLELRFGMNEESTSYTLVESAKILGISRDNVRRIQETALRRLRGRMDRQSVNVSLVRDLC